MQNSPERQFQGGDEATVTIVATPGCPGHSDITFEDGTFALEVPDEFFQVVCEADRTCG